MNALNQTFDQLNELKIEGKQSELFIRIRDTIARIHNTLEQDAVEVSKSFKEEQKQELQKTVSLKRAKKV